MINIGFITLGCPKNEVDSEYMLGMILEEDQYQFVTDYDKAEVIVINTCGFIEDAKEESIDTIIQAGKYKEKYNCQALIVTGCLTQRYREELMHEMPEIDAILGTGELDKINIVIKKALAGQKIAYTGKPSFDYRASLPRKTTGKHYSYLKIAEGCNNNCTYCSIPLIRGPVKSRLIEDIIAEANSLVSGGVKELILVAQDTTQYGVDIYQKPSLIPLLKELVKIKDLHWIRIMYSYPEFINDELINLIAKEDKICNYLDLPIQHAASKIRKKMGRKGTKEDLYKLVEQIRKKIPDISLRTSLIVGFPGETEHDFNELLEFVNQVKFDRLGVFKFSKEEDTAAYQMSNQIDAELKEKRHDLVMETQQQIAYNNNISKIGSELEVVIDEKIEDYFLARTRYDAPEVDNQVYLKQRDNINLGEFVYCKITEAFEYDLIGEIIDESTK